MHVIFVLFVNIIFTSTNTLKFSLLKILKYSIYILYVHSAGKLGCCLALGSIDEWPLFRKWLPPLIHSCFFNIAFVECVGLSFKVNYTP